MRRNDKKQRILNNIGKDLSICDKIVMNILKNYTIKVYRIGLNDGFFWNNKKLH